MYISYISKPFTINLNFCNLWKTSSCLPKTYFYLQLWLASSCLFKLKTFIAVSWAVYSIKYYRLWFKFSIDFSKSTVLNYFRQSQTTLDDIMLSVNTNSLWLCYSRHWEFNLQTLRVRGPALLDRKACSASHLSSVQWPNEPVLYWEPTRWIEPLHHGCMGHSGSTALHASLTAGRPPLCLPMVPNQGNTENR